VEGFSSLLFDKTQGIDDLDPGQRISEVMASAGIGFDPGATDPIGSQEMEPVTRRIPRHWA
jgi:hypothetical protein